MTTLKTPVGVDLPPPVLVDATGRTLSLAGYEEVARRANLHEEMVAALKWAHQHCALMGIDADDEPQARVEHEDREYERKQEEK
jgi:hypothetical protein